MFSRKSHNIRTFSPVLRQPRSLRLRLMLWYGALLAIALGFFSLLVLALATNALNQSVMSAINAEARIASLNVKRELLSRPPYWPDRLSLNTVDTYHDPGIAVEVEDIQGHERYSTLSGQDIPLSAATKHAIMTGQAPVWYKATVDGEHVQVKALPVYAPDVGGDGKVGDTASEGQSSKGGSLIGVLLVARTLNDVSSTLLLLQSLLLFAGLATLGAILIASWLIASRVLSPLAGIVTTSRAIVASTRRGTRLGCLNQRVARPSGRDELALLVDAFNEMLSSLESATNAQRRFVADASHELRAPLTTIQGNLAFLQHHYDELPGEERRMMLADAHEETLRLAKLVEELLLLARADASMGTATEVQETELAEKQGAKPLIELDHVLLQLVRQLRRRLAVEGSALKLELGHVEPVRIRADEESVRRVILILLDNAIKYTPTSGEARGRVLLSLQLVQGEAVLRVHDSGIGIEPEDLEHIFERFYRADRARSRQGTGLGLSIAQTLAEQAGGRLTAESTPGDGSTFSVWLPLA
ncbi:MAG TPA: HAMP domain-containing sensor histidine kinase [Ktedonobacteraceae bacterium]|nr:HAMP domain-containing sensor histidine kinase [Ktedonobacteraceae bacterium]